MRRVVTRKHGKMHVRYVGGDVSEGQPPTKQAAPGESTRHENLLNEIRFKNNTSPGFLPTPLWRTGGYFG
jgi:hypothetical protein